MEFYKRFRGIKNKMFRVYFGQLGEGKTYAMTRQVLKELRAGNDIFCEFS